MQQNKTIELVKTYKCDAQTLFNAISEGLLFKYTGAIMEKTKFDFKVGGPIHIVWGVEDSMEGVFTAIRPYAHIAFTWISFDPKVSRKIKTDVSINLSEERDGTRLSLLHAGFATDKSAHDHNWGWDDALQDLTKNCKKAS